MRTKKAIYNIITNILLQLIVILYGFVVPKIIINNYGSEVNGLMSSITQFLGYISLIEAGFGGIVQFLLYKPIAKKDKKTILDILSTSKKFFTKVSIIFCIYVALLCFIYPLIINTKFDSIFTVSLILIIAINIFSEYYFGLVYRIYLLAEQKKYIIAIFSIISYALNIIVIVALSKSNISVHLLKLISTLLFTLRPLLQLWYVKKKYNINLKEGNSNYFIKQKWDALAQHIASVIHNGTDITILSIFSNLINVSIYTVYYLVVSGIKKIISIFFDSISSGFGDIIARNEKQRLKEVFSISETIYYTLVTIIFSCTYLLITPFVSIYTKNVTDAVYTQELFGYLIVISELIWAFRLPYSSITLSAGHYKETRNGAIVECVVNVVLSILLVKKYGLIGVTIGTIAAMTIRTIEFIYHSSKYVLNRSILIPIKRIAIMIVEMVMIIIIHNYLPLIDYTNYYTWIINALIIFGVSCLVCILNFIFYFSDFKKICKLFKDIFKKRRRVK